MAVTDRAIKLETHYNIDFSISCNMMHLASTVLVVHLIL